MVVNPVMFPPGRARLSTTPLVTGSDTFPKTIGIVRVAFLAARTPFVDAVTMTSTLRRTSSSVREEILSRLPSGSRNSNAIFLPSTQPSACNSRRIPSRGERDPPRTSAIFTGCAAVGKQSKKYTPNRTKQNILLFIVFVSRLPPQRSRLPNHPIRPR